MAESSADRLRGAVDVVLERNELGDTTANRLRRAIGELVGEGDDGRAVVVGEYRRVAAAVQDGRLAPEVFERITGLLMAGWANPNVKEPPVRRAGSSRPTTRTSKNRDLAYVPDGTVVVYDGVHATIRGGRITVEGGRGTYDKVTPAAKAVVEQEAINGWRAWRLLDGRFLGDAYDEGRW